VARSPASDSQVPVSELVPVAAQVAVVEQVEPVVEQVEPGVAPAAEERSHRRPMR
jgi:hypothetical protein